MSQESKPKETKEIPESTISRLFAYLREVSKLFDFKIRTISSSELGERINLSGAQVRKDLGYFGNFGVSGSGYDTKELKEALEKILKKNKISKVAIVGAGNLGSALLSYFEFKHNGIDLAAAFDTDPKKIGKDFGNTVVQHFDDMEKTIRKKKILIGVIAVPPQKAQEVADKLINAGVKCILNFAPVGLNLPDGIIGKDVDLSREIETLSYFANNSNDNI